MTVIKTKRFSWQESICKLDPWKLFTEQCLDFSLEGETRCNAMEQFLRKKICLFRCVAARSNWSIVKSWPLWLHPTNTNRNLRTASGQWSLGFAEKWTQSFTNRNVREHLSVLGKTRHLGQLHHHLCHSAL